MHLCFFGTYEIGEGYPVNRVLLKGLRSAGAKVEECREEIWGGFLHAVFSKGGWATYGRLLWRILRRYPKLMWHYPGQGEHQAVIIGYFGYLDVLVARLLNWRRRRPLILVSFISLYDTIVVDRGQWQEHSRKAHWLKKIERLAFASADIVLVDTWQQAAYYADLFTLPPAKFQRSFVGEDDEQFTPAAAPEKRREVLQVLFFGTYVPLHGIEVILAAAQHLLSHSSVKFTLIGNGQLYPQMRQKAEERQLDNINFIDTWVSTKELIQHIRAADVCLGIFGQTAKAERVIPYKVFDALSQQRPVVTRDSAAIRELLHDGETALLCGPDGEQLAAAILRLRDDPALAQRIAVNGYACYRQQGSPAAIGGALLALLEERFAN